MPEIELQLRRLAAQRGALVPVYSPPATRARRRHQRAWAGALAAVVVAALVIGAIALVSVDERSPSVETPTATAEEPTLRVGRSRALPFQVEWPFTAAGGELWFAGGFGGLVAYDPVTGETRSVDATPLAEHYAPAPARFSPTDVVAQGDTLWAADRAAVQSDGGPGGPASFERHGGVVRVDAATGRIEAVVAVPGRSPPTDVVVSGSGEVWATGGGTLIEIDPTTNTATRTVPLGGSGNYTDLVVDGGVAWLGDFDSSQIVKIDLTTGAVLDRLTPSLGAHRGLPADASNFPIALSGNALVVATRGARLTDPQALRLVDTRTGRVRATRILDGAGFDAAVNDSIVLVATDAGIVSFDLDGLAQRGKVELESPGAIRFVAFDGDHAWLTERPALQATPSGDDEPSTLRRVRLR
jgi:hypothetical protein